jgi:hypothetical protein
LILLLPARAFSSIGIYLITNTKEVSIMKIEEAYKQLEDAFKGFTGRESWMEYLKFSSRFRGYSMNNTIMIYIQNPEARYLKGSKGVRIFAPMTYRKKKDEEDVDYKVTYNQPGRVHFFNPHEYFLNGFNGYVYLLYSYERDYNQFKDDYKVGVVCRIVPEATSFEDVLNEPVFSSGFT